VNKIKRWKKVFYLYNLLTARKRKTIAIAPTRNLCQEMRRVRLFSCLIALNLANTADQINSSSSEISRQKLKLGHRDIDVLRNLQFQEAIDAIGHIEIECELSPSPSDDRRLWGQGVLSAGVRTSFIGELKEMLSELLCNP
jgi:hypothetical protein